MDQFIYMAAIILPENTSDLVSYFSHEFIMVRSSIIVITLQVKYQTFQTLLRIVPFYEYNITKHLRVFHASQEFHFRAKEILKFLSFTINKINEVDTHFPSSSMDFFL